MTATVQPDLFQWSPPAPAAAPTVEPTPEKFRRASGDPRDYRAAWMADRYATAAAAKACADCGAPSSRYRRCQAYRMRRAAYNAEYRARRAA